MGDAQKATAGAGVGRGVDASLGYRAGEKPEGAENQPNGFRINTVIGVGGGDGNAVPRDRSGSFEPLLIAEGQKRFEGFDEKIIAMYARGMTVREPERSEDSLPLAAPQG